MSPVLDLRPDPAFSPAMRAYLSGYSAAIQEGKSGGDPTRAAIEAVIDLCAQIAAAVASEPGCTISAAGAAERIARSIVALKIGA